jgi:hypothetical protein
MERTFSQRLNKRETDSLINFTKTSHFATSPFTITMNLVLTLFPFLVVVSLLLNVDSFQNGDVFHSLQHRRRAGRIRNNNSSNNNHNNILEANHHPLRYKSTTLVGDHESHSFWFQQQQEGDDHVTTAPLPSTSSTSATSTINNRHSSADWFYNLQTIPSSSVLRETKGPVLSLAGWATFVSVVHSMLRFMGKHHTASLLSIPSSAHGFVVSSLGLLLVFRTNSAYQRFLVSTLY